MFTFILVLVCFCLVAVLFVNNIEEKEKVNNLNKLINILTTELNTEKNKHITLTSAISTTNSVLKGELSSELNSLYIREDLLKRELQEINRRRNDLGSSIDIIII